MKQHGTTHLSTAKNAALGFTLVELMITLAIIGILATIAYPSYQDHVIRSNRATAQVCLTEMAQFMERFYTTNMRYDRTAAGVAVALPVTNCSNELRARYDFAFTAAPTATTYSIGATAKGSQANDKSCKSLALDNTGQKTPASGCWK